MIPSPGCTAASRGRRRGSRPPEARAARRRPPSPPIEPIADRPMSRYWSAVVAGLTPYVPGEQPKLDKLVKLNTNEHPYGPSPKALEAIRAATGDALRLYPDPNADALKAALAQRHGVAPQQIFVGNGSDEVLAHAFMACSSTIARCGSRTSATASTRCIAGCTASRTAASRSPKTSPSGSKTTFRPARRAPARSSSPTRTPPPAAPCAWPRSSASSPPIRTRWCWWTRPMSTSAARARSRWSTATPTCSSPTPSPRAARSPGCAWATRSAMRT